MTALILAVMVCLCAVVNGQDRQGVWTREKNSEIQTVGNAIVKTEWHTLQFCDVDTFGTLHDQWVWGQLSYREYLNLRLGRPKHDWADYDTVYFVSKGSLAQGWYECSKPTDSIEMRNNIFINTQRKDWRQCLRLYAYALRACW